MIGLLIFLKKWIGNTETIRGKGVVGRQPILLHGGTYQYSSQVSLKSPRGYMWGSFIMVNEVDEPLECKIPAFTLECLREDDIDTDPILGI